jgi:hypothetical protein
MRKYSGDSSLCFGHLREQDREVIYCSSKLRYDYPVEFRGVSKTVAQWHGMHFSVPCIVSINNSAVAYNTPPEGQAAIIRGECKAAPRTPITPSPHPPYSFIVPTSWLFGLKSHSFPWPRAEYILVPYSKKEGKLQQTSAFPLCL